MGWCPIPEGAAGAHGPFAYGSEPAVVSAAGWLLVLYAVMAVALTVGAAFLQEARGEKLYQGLFNAPLTGLLLLWNVIFFFLLGDQPVFCGGQGWDFFAWFTGPVAAVVVLVNWPLAGRRRDWRGSLKLLFPSR